MTDVNPESEINIVIKANRRQQIEIEEYCINEGLSFSQYFMKLHEERKNRASGLMTYVKHTNDTTQRMEELKQKYDTKNEKNLKMVDQTLNRLEDHIEDHISKKKIKSKK